MTDREKIINAIEKAKKQSEEYAQDRIIVPFKEADMILALLKEQEAKTVLNAGWKAVGNNKVFYGNCPNCQRRLYAKTSNYCQYCGKKVKWE